MACTFSVNVKKVYEMAKILETQKREHVGKRSSRRYRREGMIPGVYYYHGEEAVPIIFNSKMLTLFLNTAHGLIDLKIEGEKETKKCVLKEIQSDPVTGNFLHVDFLGVKMGEKITVKVPLVLKGLAPGIKAGGILEHLIRDLEIECFPRHLPEKLEIDVSSLEISDSIHVKDLNFENILILDDPDDAIVILEAPRVVVEEVEEVLEEEMEEPEVIGEKKPEEETTDEKTQES